jgi:NAD(P)-dependent dehydrogenase (short-subunit alcohol dehydrogenase family)
MKEFRDKVAVVTGGASGIGRGFAERCVQEGVKVVLADIEEPALSDTSRDLRNMGGTVIAVRTDVSKGEDIEALAQETISAFGAVHLLFNNAGVGAGTTVWESTLPDWEWVMGVNLWGVIHGVRVFVPIMLRQEAECHIVNTASGVGMLSYHPSAPYLVAKHGVVALSEHLYHSLVHKGTKIGVSVLCPGWVNTRILDSARNRPAGLPTSPLSPELQAALPEMEQALREGLTPHQVADQVFQAIMKEQLYVLAPREIAGLVRQRMEDIMFQRNPAKF